MNTEKQDGSPTCNICKRPAKYSVPRLGPDGGFVHADGTHLCPTPAPTPRTDAVWQRGASILEHAQQLETELAASDLDRNRLWTEAAKAKVELDTLKAELKALKISISCEGMDPSGTIWDHADKVQKANTALKDRIATLEHQLAEEVGPHYMDTALVTLIGDDWNDSLRADGSFDFRKSLLDSISAVQQERDELKAEVLDAVEDRAREQCHTAPQATDYLGHKAGELVTDSGASSSRADDLWRLHDAGRFRVHASTGRMVVGYWPENDPNKSEGDKSP
jgi:hypothetical protein